MFYKFLSESRNRKQNDCKRKMKFDPMETSEEEANEHIIVLRQKKQSKTDEVKRRWQNIRQKTKELQLSSINTQRNTAIITTLLPLTINPLRRRCKLCLKCSGGTLHCHTHQAAGQCCIWSDNGHKCPDKRH